MQKIKHGPIRCSQAACLLAGLAQLCLALPSYAQALNAWMPSRNVELVVGSGVGGPLDLGARTIQKIWHDTKMVESSVIVINKPGAGGLLGFNHLNQHAGDGHYLAITSPTLISNHIVGASPVGYTDLTPVAVLFNEYVAMGVRTESGMKSVREMIATLKAAPESISVSIAAALGNHNHIGIAMATRQAGGDVRKLKIVVNKSSGESATVLLGGHVDMATATVSNFVPHLKTGKLRVLAVAAPKRLGGELASIPTLAENGQNVVVGGWRAIVGPRNMTPPQLAYWQGVFSRLSQNPEWNEDLNLRYNQNTYMSPQESAKFFESETVAMRSLLTELGMARKAAAQ